MVSSKYGHTVNLGHTPSDAPLRTYVRKEVNAHSSVYRYGVSYIVDPFGGYFLKFLR